MHDAPWETAAPDPPRWGWGAPPEPPASLGEGKRDRDGFGEGSRSHPHFVRPSNTSNACPAGKRARWSWGHGHAAGRVLSKKNLVLSAASQVTRSGPAEDVPQIGAHLLTNTSVFHVTRLELAVLPPHTLLLPIFSSGCHPCGGLGAISKGLSVPTLWSSGCHPRGGLGVISKGLWVLSPRGSGCQPPGALGAIPVEVWVLSPRGSWCYHQGALGVNLLELWVPELFSFFFRSSPSPSVFLSAAGLGDAKPSSFTPRPPQDKNPNRAGVA